MRLKSIPELHDLPRRERARAWRAGERRISSWFAAVELLLILAITVIWRVFDHVMPHHPWLAYLCASFLFVVGWNVLFQLKVVRIRPILRGEILR